MLKIVFFSALCVLTCATGQRITTIHLDGVQYFISRMNPYSPELNYFLAYQYCRSLGLQLASFETKEKTESMTTYLKNAGYGNYDFWTSGNRLGTGMFLWMSTGLPFNATFDFFENSSDAIQSGLLDPIDHNSNTSPQRTARDSSSGAEKGCVILRQPTLKWMPEDCSAVKDFICEQTRCYYYNYGSIPVSSSQGRPITATTSYTTTSSLSTTAIPVVVSTYSSFVKTSQQDGKLQSAFDSLKQEHDRVLKAEENNINDINEGNKEHSVLKETNDDHSLEFDNVTEGTLSYDEKDFELEDNDTIRYTQPPLKNEQHQHLAVSENDKGEDRKAYKEKLLSTMVTENYSATMTMTARNAVQPNESTPTHSVFGIVSTADPTEISLVELRLKRPSHDIEQFESNDDNSSQPSLKTLDFEDVSRKSFLSLTDLIRTLHPNDKQIIPQIDSDYSNAMRTLGEISSVVSSDETRKY